MKICQISNLYNPYIIGGAEIYAERLSKELSTNNEVIVLTSQPFKNIRDLLVNVNTHDKIKVYSFYPLNIYHAYFAKNKPIILKPFWHVIDIWNYHSYLIVRSILKKEQPDIVHTHNLNGISLSIGKAIRKNTLRWIHTAHDFSFFCPLANYSCKFTKTKFCSNNPFSFCGLYKSLKKKLIDDCPDLVIFPSTSCRSVYQENGIFLKQKNCILPYGIGIPDDPPIKRYFGFNVLYAGQLVEHKGIGLLVEVFKRIAAKDWRLHIAGDGELRKTLEELAGQDNRIKFYGNLSSQTLRTLYRQVDVTVVPSLWPEVLGIVILESLACATPVIASSIGGMTEIIKDRYNGLLFEPGNADGLQCLLKLMASNPKLTRRMRSNALRSSNKFLMENHIYKLMDFYENLLNRPRGA